jgi:AmmeMemoRadiSam system protein A
VNLTQEEKRALLQSARGAIAAALGLPAAPAPEPTAALQEPCGAFVTLHEKTAAGEAQLRGCIGYLETSSPLALTVRHAATAAALHDGRFAPVTASELPRLEIEISVLSPLRRVRDVSEIVVGEHGIVMRRGMRSGLLLPQVASERGWDLETFLDHTCLKAGLPRRAWTAKDTTIEVFSALVFGEGEFSILNTNV